MTKSFVVVATGAIMLLCTSLSWAQEEAPKPVLKPAEPAMKNLPPKAQVPKKQPQPSAKEKALLAQLSQLEKQRDALIKRSAELDRKRFSTQDPEERKRLDRQKLDLLKEMDAVVTRRKEVSTAWQKAAMERFRKESPEAFQSPPGMPPGMAPGMSPQTIAKQIEIAKEQLSKLKKEGKPDNDPQVKMYRERVERYTQMLKASAAKPPTSPAPKPAVREK